MPAAIFVLAGFFVAAAIFVPSANLLLAAMFLPAAIFLLAGIFVFLFCFAALRPKLTAMFVARQSAHLSTPFLGKLEEAVKPVLPAHTFAYNWQQPLLNNSAEGNGMTVEIISWSISSKYKTGWDTLTCSQTPICSWTRYRLPKRPGNHLYLCKQQFLCQQRF